VQFRLPGQAEAQAEINVTRLGRVHSGTDAGGKRYTFKVSGCGENSIRGVKNCSDFTEPVVVQAARNTNSLRRFLAGADASSGIRRSMIAPPPLPPERFGLSCANNRLQWF
jgi:hypothetical protein